MKKFLATILIAVILLAVCAACDLYKPSITIPDVTDEPYVGFSDDFTEELDLDLYNRVDAERFLDYRHRYAPYSAQVYYHGLAAADQRIYHIFQYAMDNAYPCILIDEQLMTGMEHSVEDILNFFSLDSAVVEQNLSWQYREITLTYTVGLQTTQLKGVQLYIDDFSAKKQNLKDKAINQAEEILSQMPEDCVSDLEKARYFYSWLGENVEYHADQNRDENADYLYDALCRGKTNCDGFANAFSLLCAMEGITCCEKIYVPGDGSAGHTWNTVKLDGTWFNVDATASSKVLSDCPEETWLRFGFSDACGEYSWEFSEQVAVCEENLFGLYCCIASSAEAPRQIKEGFAQMQTDYLVVVVETGAMSQSVLEEIAQALQCTITTHHYILADGSALYCIYTH